MDDLNACVGHHQIAGAVDLHHLVEAGFDLFLAGHVHADGDGGQALCLQLLRKGFRTRQIHIGDDHAVALPCHFLHAGFSNAGSAAGNQCSFHHDLSFFWYLSGLSCSTLKCNIAQFTSNVFRQSP